MRFFSLSRLPHRLALITATIALAVALVSSGIEAVLFYAAERDAQRAVIERVLDLETGTASQALYEMDSQLAERIIRALVDFSYIAAARIEDDFGVVLASAEADAPHPRSDFLARNLGVEELTLTRTLTSPNWEEPLGKLVVTVDRHALLSDLAAKTLARIASVSVQFLVVAALLGLVFHLSVIRPLLRMVERVSTLRVDQEPGPLIAPPHSLKNTEIGLLADAMNGIVTRAREEIGRRVRFGDALRRNEARLARAQAVAQLGSFEHDLEADQFHWSDEQYHLLGYAVGEVEPSMDALLDALEPSDRKRLVEHYARARRDAAPLRLEVTYSPDGEQHRQAQIVAEMEVDDEGVPVNVLGTFQDITKRKRAEEALRQSEERYALVTKGANDGIWDWDTMTDQVYFSPRWKQILGYSDLEVANEYNSWVSMLHPDDLEYALRVAEETARGERDSFAMVFRMLHKDGSVRWILGRGAALIDASGKVVRVGGTHTDITRMKETELALKIAEAKYRTIFNNAPIGIFRSTVDGRLLEANPATAAMFGYRDRRDMLERVSSIPDDLYFDPDERARMVADLARVGTHHTVVTFKRQDGEAFHANLNVTLIPGEDGQDDILDGTIEDITEWRKAQDAIRQSRERYHRLFTEMQEGFALHRAIADDFGKGVDYEFIEANPAFETLTGLPAAETVGRTVHELLPEVDDQWVEACCAVAFGSPPFTAMQDSPHLERTFQVRVYSPEPGLFAAIFSDVTSEREAELLLRNSEEKYREIFNATSDAIVLYEVPSLAVADVNRAFCELFGYDRDEALGLRPWEISAQPRDEVRERIAPLLDNILQGETVAFEWRGRHKNGESFWTENMAKQVRFGGTERILLVIRDITERRGMQEMMVQTEKMMSVGGLAAGMAHEINNPLGIITLMSQNLQRRFSADLPANARVAREIGLDLDLLVRYMRERNIDDHVGSIRDAADRAAAIVRSMLNFSRKPKMELEACSLSGLIDSVIELAASDYDLKKNYDFRKVRIIRDFGPDVPEVECTPTEISQVLLNILKNSAQALGSSPDTEHSPEITVRTTFDQGFIRIEIADNGPGMDETTRRRLFEPFYTTKAPGIGTGLGMSVSYFIITSKYGGSISVDSAPGEGARFVIRLPHKQPSPNQEQ